MSGAEGTGQPPCAHRVLVTGATGYLGGRLVHDWVAAGRHELVCVAREVESLRPIAGSAKRVALDLSRDQGALARALAGCSALVHLAEPNEVVCERDPEAAERMALATAHNVVEAALAHDLERVVWISSLRAVGRPPAAMIDEQTPPEPRDVYGRIKRATELLAEQASARGLAVYVLRLTNLVGPLWDPTRDRHTPLVISLCRQAAQGQALRLRSDGLDYLDVLAMGEAVRAIDHVLSTPRDRLAHTLYHVSSGRPTRVLDLAELVCDRIERASGHRPLLHAQPARPGPPPAPVTCDNRRLQEAGFTAEDKLLDEIDATVGAARSG